MNHVFLEKTTLNKVKHGSVPIKKFLYCLFQTKILHFSRNFIFSVVTWWLRQNVDQTIYSTFDSEKRWRRIISQIKWDVESVTSQELIQENWCGFFVKIKLKIIYEKLGEISADKIFCQVIGRYFLKHGFIKDIYSCYACCFIFGVISFSSSQPKNWYSDFIFGHLLLAWIQMNQIEVIYQFNDLKAMNLFVVKDKNVSAFISFSRQL